MLAPLSAQGAEIVLRALNVAPNSLGEDLKEASIPVINMAALAIYSLNDCPIDTGFEFTDPPRVS